MFQSINQSINTSKNIRKAQSHITYAPWNKQVHSEKGKKKHAAKHGDAHKFLDVWSTLLWTAASFLTWAKKGKKKKKKSRPATPGCTGPNLEWIISSTPVPLNHLKIWPWKTFPFSGIFVFFSFYWHFCFLILSSYNSSPTSPEQVYFHAQLLV